jgi:ATP-dependent RNA helicase DDX52/ROK1
MSLVQALQQGAIKLDKLKHLVFDEADKLLELGFLEQADEILAACPVERQTSMFSATLASAVESLAKTVMRNDVIRVIIGTKYVDDESLKIVRCAMA